MSLFREVKTQVLQADVTAPIGKYVLGATTLNVGGVQYVSIANASATTIATIVGGVIGKVVTLTFKDANTTVAGANIKLSAAFVATANDTLSLVFDGTNYLEVARSVNAA